MALAGLLVLTVLGVVGFRVAVYELEQQIEAALGPRGQVGSLAVTWAGVEAREVRVRGDRSQRWPAEDELRAKRVLVVPDLLGLLSADVRIRQIVVEGGYVSMLRTRDGRLKVLPALTGAQPARSKVRDGAPMRPVSIASIELRDATLEFFDASVRRPALKLRLEQLEAQVGPLDFPALDSSTQVELDGVLKGVHRDGRVHIGGDVTFATRDADLNTRFTGVDLVALQPYLIKVSEAGVRRGTMDLRLDATVKNKRLRAPGHLTLTDLKLESSGGVLSTFAGVPRQAVIAAMSKDRRLELDFTLEGRLDDPKFSLNENLAMQVASGLANALGVSVGGVVEGVGSVVKGLFGR